MFGNRLQQLQKKFEANKRAINIKLGVASENHFKDSFRNQGFMDATLEKWDEVQRRKQGTKAYKAATKAARTRAILVQTGKLKRDIARRRTTYNEVTIGTSNLTINYAERHNYGERKMPKRQFIGKSRRLNEKLIKIIKFELNKILKP